MMHLCIVLIVESARSIPYGGIKLLEIMYSLPTALYRPAQFTCFTGIIIYSTFCLYTLFVVWLKITYHFYPRCHFVRRGSTICFVGFLVIADRVISQMLFSLGGTRVHGNACHSCCYLGAHSIT
jgi:hypothetical protein